MKLTKDQKKTISELLDSLKKEEIATMEDTTKIAKIVSLEIWVSESQLLQNILEDLLKQPTMTVYDFKMRRIDRKLKELNDIKLPFQFSKNESVNTYHTNKVISEKDFLLEEKIKLEAEKDLPENLVEL